jgi:hypothetical protein
MDNAIKFAIHLRNLGKYDDAIEYLLKLISEIRT